MSLRRQRSLAAMSRRPDWLKVRLPGSGRYYEVRKRLGQLKLHTVCSEARCPNIAECWGSGTATFMILGKVCTRGCRFCDVASGQPPAPPDADEPQRVAEAVARMQLRYAVITSVDRDDLVDGGAEHFGRVVAAVLARNPEVLVDLLTPDFGGDRELVSRVASCGAHVLGHNLETVRRLTPALRDRRCDYDRSLEVLTTFGEADPMLVVKSSLLLGLGETPAEIAEALADLRRAGVHWVTLGQYLQPSRKHAEVERYLPPEAFEGHARQARALGFELVTAGPLVRSSYRAAEAQVDRLIAKRRATLPVAKNERRQ